MDIKDVVEEISLTAFDRFDHRRHTRVARTVFGTLIDDAVHALLAQPEEQRNISFLRSAGAGARAVAWEAS